MRSNVRTDSRRPFQFYESVYESISAIWIVKPNEYNKTVLVCLYYREDMDQVR